MLLPNGHKVPIRDFTPKYEEHITGMNRVGAFLVAVWIWPFFLLVVGFGYSYFWSASTIIYFLMRRNVDDTEMDEVYLENDELDESFTTPKPALPQRGRASRARSASNRRGQSAARRCAAAGGAPRVAVAQ